jgi:hypothetical protein
MARMSIDDMFLRDPRILRLAKACAWSKFETLGRLLHVYAIVYDRVDAGADDIVSAEDIDTASDLDGFATLLIEHGLAEPHRRGVRIRGARERTNYLATRKTTGQLGGIKSGESRRNKAKQQTKVTFNETEGRANPSAVPASVPVVAPAPAPLVVVMPEPESPGFAEIKSKGRKVSRAPSACHFPSDWTPAPEAQTKALADGLNCAAEAEAFRDHHTAKGTRFTDWDAAFRTWLRNAVKFASNSNRPQGQSKAPVGRAEPLPMDAYLADEGRAF